MNEEKPQLKRSIGLLALVIYGVGDTLGAGIYALVGKVAGLMGAASWMSFGIAFVAAILTGLTYAELASRFPRAGGVAAYSLQAFKNSFVSYLAGVLVILSGMFSMATVSHAFAGYLHVFMPFIPKIAAIIFFLSLLAVINFSGIDASIFTNSFCTCIELAGISLVIAAGMKFFGHVNYLEVTPPAGMPEPQALLQGAVFAFFAFIGFEDLANMAEEVKDPVRILPRGIVLSLLVICGVYMSTAIAAVSAVPFADLAASNAPLLMVVNKGFPAIPSWLFSVIALFAVSNTALANFIMGSRMLYGMAHDGLVPKPLGRVHSKTQTPHIAILCVYGVVLFLAASGTIVLLAQSTSLLLLTVFILMHVSLLIVKRKEGETAPFRIPKFVPFAGIAICFLLVFYVNRQAFVTVGILTVIAVALYALQLRFMTRK